MRIKTEKSDIYIFLDNLIMEYNEYYGYDSEKIVIKDLNKYLSSLSVSSKITIITKGDKLKVTEWLHCNNLLQFVESINNSKI